MKKLLSIILLVAGVLLPMKLWAQDKVYEPYFQFEGDNLLMLCDTEGATIYYVIEPYSADMSEDEAYTFAESLQVNDQSAVYSNPIPISENVIIKAVAVKQGMASSDPSTLIYNYLAWKDLEKAILYGSDVLSRAQDNPNVDQSLKEDLQWRIEEGEHFYYERAWMDSHQAEHFSQEIMDIARQIEEQMGGGTTTAEPYAVLSDNNTVLTFYYDDQKTARGGMDINNSYIDVNSSSPYGSVTTAVIDASFADYRPTSTAYWFENCSSLTSITGMENLKTENVTNMRYMFFNCGNLTSLDVSNFKTDNVTDMFEMFWGCRILTSLDVSNFNTDKVTDMGAIFMYCSGLMSLDVTGFNTQNVTRMNGMFYDCSGLTSLDVTGFKTDNVTDMGSMFFNCSGLTSLDVTHFNTQNVTRMDGMFANCAGLTSLDVSKFKTDNVTIMNGMFGGCSGLTSLDVTGFKTDNVTNMGSMFYGCSGLTSLDVSGFKTDKVTNMGSMFSECSILTSLDVSNFNTANVTDMSWMFEYCPGLTSLDVSKFKTDNVTDMAGMFSECSGLTSLDLSSFNTSKLIYNLENYNYGISSMFSGCSNLTTIYVGDGWTTANLTESANVFKGCTRLVGGAGTHYDANHIDHAYAHIDGGVNNPGYFTAAGAEPWKDIDTVVLTGKINNYWYDVTGSDPNGDEAIIFTIPEVPEEGMEWEFNILGTFIQNQLAFTTADGEAVDNIIGDILFETKGNMVAIQDGKMLIYESENERGEIAMVDPYSGMIRIIGNEITLRLLNEPNSKFMALPLCVKANQNGRDVTVTNGSFTVLVQSPKQVQEPEPYAVLSQNNTVLTFYYDDQREQRNGLGIESNREWREYAEDITTVIFDPSFSSCRPTSTSFWFFGFTNLTSVVGIENLNTSDVSNMAQMFTSCSSLTNLDVSRFNTVNVTNMAAMFADCRNLTSLDVSGFNTAKVTDMGGMFENCLSLTNLDLSHFDTHNVTDMVQMFFGCSALTTLDVSNFNTENVKAFFLMFAACRSLTSLDVSSFNTASATEIDRMFSQCTGLTTLDLHNFNTDNVTNMSDMFFECSNLKSINISNFITSKVANFNSMFQGCSNLASIQAGSANIPAEEYARIGNPNLLVYVNEASLAPQGVQNVVINGEAKEIILTDVTEGNNNWYCPEAFTAEKISYTRNFGQQTEVGVSRGWESIALPFTVQEITHESKGQITPFGANGTKHFWLRGYSPDGLYSATTLEANKPYVISMPNNTVVYPDAYNLNGRVTFSASNTTVPATPSLEEMMVVRDNIIMMPTFQYIPQNEYVYAVNVGQARERYAEGSVFARDLRDVRPFEAYTTHGERNGARPNFIRIAAQPNNETVGIKDNLQFDNLQFDNWYSIDGRQIQGEPQRKGVYIQKGKKVVR